MLSQSFSHSAKPPAHVSDASGNDLLLAKEKPVSYASTAEMTCSVKCGHGLFEKPDEYHTPPQENPSPLKSHLKSQGDLNRYVPAIRCV